MVDIEKRVSFWRQGAQDDIGTAGFLLEGKRVRPALFFAHLALEKILKAHVCEETQDLAPRIHNLRRLASLARLELSREYLEILARMNEFNIEGRYPELLSGPPSQAEARKYMADAQEVFDWLTKM